MSLAELSSEQSRISDWQIYPHLFVSGLAGTGKTTAAQSRLLSLLEAGIPGEEILILVPQRTLGFPYQQIIRQPGLPPGGQPSIVTIGGIAQRQSALFWPLVARAAGFKHPDHPPTFLTLETTQYFLTRIVKPLLSEGYFESITIDQNRLFSQIIDNLNKASAVGFSPETISNRLKSAWGGKPGQEIVYEQAQDCALRFRQYCLDNNLLDFSLQLYLFANHIWPSYIAKTFLTQTYRHLIYDNIEEDIPVAHDIIREWLPGFETALILFDEQAGYRAFLGADPDSASGIKNETSQSIQLDRSFTGSPTIHLFKDALASSITGRAYSPDPAAVDGFTLSMHRFNPELIDWVCQQINDLVEQGVPPGRIAILSPYLSDSLRFSVMNRLTDIGIPVRSHRPSRSLRDEPATHCLLTCAALAFPGWNIPLSREQVRSTILQSIAGLDLVRADLMAQTLFQPKNAATLQSFDNLKFTLQDRITFVFGERYETFRNWLQGNPPEQELDIFIARLFGELLSQPGFGFHDNLEAAGITTRLIESIQKFRRVAAPTLKKEGHSVGQEYVQMVSEGVIAAQYLSSWDTFYSDAVLLAPAHTFLMNNQSVDYQFWLDISSMGWWERLFQPLTHPVVLSRGWQDDRKWTDADENQTNQQSLLRLVTGLLNRCNQHVFLCTSGIDERGNHQRGPLIRSIQTILLNLSANQE